MRMVGFNTQQVGHGVCYLGVAQRQGLRTRGPIGLDALADNIVTLNVRDLEAWFKGGIQALTKIGVWSPR